MDIHPVHRHFIVLAKNKKSVLDLVIIRNAYLYGRDDSWEVSWAKSGYWEPPNSHTCTHLALPADWKRSFSNLELSSCSLVATVWIRRLLKYRSYPEGQKRVLLLFDNFSKKKMIFLLFWVMILLNLQEMDLI